MKTLRGIAFSMSVVAFGNLPAEGAGRNDEKEQFYKMVAADLEGAKDEYSRWCALGPVAKASVEMGRLKDAKLYAEELQRLMPKYPKDWNYGNAVHDTNIVLGRLALKAGDLKAAKEHLLAAGHTPGSPQLDSFGPDMTLASELLAKKEKDVVLEYLTLCGKFWKGEEGRLAKWRKEVEEGRVPNFSPMRGGGESSGADEDGKALRR